MKSIHVLFIPILTILIEFCSISAFAQPGNPGGNPDIGAPLDGGILTALIGGLGVGVYKMLKNKKG